MSVPLTTGDLNAKARALVERHVGAIALLARIPTVTAVELREALLALAEELGPLEETGHAEGDEGGQVLRQADRAGEE